MKTLLPFAILFAMTAGSALAQEVPATSIFHPPVPLKADGKIISTGQAWGHSAPAVVDLNGDGLEDLVVGDFGGKFRRYLNTGAENAPVYGKGELIEAGGVPAEVEIYCCIGSQARFHDLNGDGILDIIANSYDPGHCYLFWGLPNNKFAAREELVDKAGVPIRSAPVQKQDYQSFGSFFEAVDWDEDGDLDLLIGCFDGGLKVRINEGTPKEWKFAEKNMATSLKVKAHFCPVVADWNGDGLWDIIAGSDDGSITWFRNTGQKGTPVFADSETLVEKHDGHGYNRLIWSEDEILPGIRSQPEVTDYNGDGKLDLLVGDFYTAYDVKPNLTDEQKQEVRNLIKESQSLGKEVAAKMEALREDFKKRYPGDEIFSDKADKEWSEAYRAIRESPEAKKMEEHEKVFVKKLRPFLAETQGTGDRSFDLAKSHGYVWLFLRK